MARLSVRVQPSARRSAFVGWFGDLPKITVAEPPVGGGANDAAVRLLAKVLGLRPRQILLIGGAASRTKRFDVAGMEHDEIIAVFESLIPCPNRSPTNPPASR